MRISSKLENKTGKLKQGLKRRTKKLRTSEPIYDKERDKILSGLKLDEHSQKEVDRIINEQQRKTDAQFNVNATKLPRFSFKKSDLKNYNKTRQEFINCLIDNLRRLYVDNECKLEQNEIDLLMTAFKKDKKYYEAEIKRITASKKSKNVFRGILVDKKTLLNSLKDRINWSSVIVEKLNCIINCKTVDIEKKISDRKNIIKGLDYLMCIKPDTKRMESVLNKVILLYIAYYY